MKHMKDYGRRNFRSGQERIIVRRRIDVSGFGDYQDVTFERTVRLVKDLSLQADAVLPSGRILDTSSTFCEYGSDGLQSLDSIFEYAMGEECAEYRAMGCTVSVHAKIHRRHEDCLRAPEWGKGSTEVDVFAAVPSDWSRDNGTPLSPYAPEFDECIFVFGADAEENRERRDRFLNVLVDGTTCDTPAERLRLQEGFRRLDRTTEPA